MQDDDPSVRKQQSAADATGYDLIAEAAAESSEDSVFVFVHGMFSFYLFLRTC